MYHRPVSSTPTHKSCKRFCVPKPIKATWSFSFRPHDFSCDSPCDRPQEIGLKTSRWRLNEKMQMEFQLCQIFDMIIRKYYCNVSRSCRHLFVRKNRGCGRIKGTKAAVVVSGRFFSDGGPKGASIVSLPLPTPCTEYR